MQQHCNDTPNNSYPPLFPSIQATMTTSSNTEFHSCGSHFSDDKITTHNSRFWKAGGVPTEIHVRMHSHESSGGLLSDRRVGSDELENLDIVSILTDDRTDLTEDTSDGSMQQEQGVNRVVEALRSFQARRLAEKEAQPPKSTGPSAPKAVKQQRFFSSRQRSVQNISIPQTPTNQGKREKSRQGTPETMAPTPDKMLSGEPEKGLKSLRRFLTFGKAKVESPAGPGLACMGEEDTVQ